MTESTEKIIAEVVDSVLSLEVYKYINGAVIDEEDHSVTFFVEDAWEREGEFTGQLDDELWNKLMEIKDEFLEYF